MKIVRYPWLALLALAAITTTSAPAVAQQPQKPNIITADDIGSALG
jgi:hypothetical protein